MAEKKKERLRKMPSYEEIEPLIGWVEINLVECPNPWIERNSDATASFQTPEMKTEMGGTYGSRRTESGSKKNRKKVTKQTLHDLGFFLACAELEASSSANRFRAVGSLEREDPDARIAISRHFDALFDAWGEVWWW
ncbi:hypothetical protein DFH09DRAFT_1069296 [Mycena vulgaris]|nr:hypothetical protein DFH09DRAFT_1069296 [Mycena vulgaris]